MPSDEPLPEPPDISLEVLDVEAGVGAGFLALRRRRLVAHYPDGSASEPFLYDEVERRHLDAVVIAAHCCIAGRTHVVLRSALRPPVVFRDAATSPVKEPGNRGLWELPAGLVEDDEQSPAGLVRAAQRELLEEAGFDMPGDAFRPLGGSSFPAPAVLAERHFFLQVEVSAQERGEPTLDGSALEHGGEVILVPLDEALRCCVRGGFGDAKTELGIWRLAAELKRFELP